MIKRIWQLFKAGFNYAVMFSAGFGLTFVMFYLLVLGMDMLLEFVTVTDPIYNGWFHTLTITASLVVSLIVGIIFLGVEEEERRREKQYD